jgi:hypothetical protein
VVGVVVAVVALYAVLLNVVLLSPLLRTVANRQGRAVHIEYSRAYFVLPDRVHVEGLRLRGGDRHVEWLVQVDHCTFGLELLPLLRRQFHASFVDADGVSVRARLLVNKANPAHDDFVPPIPGFVSPALKPVGPPHAPISDAEYNLVTVTLENVDARHVREIWVDTTRFAGDYRVRGRWVFRPVRYLEIGPATVDVALLDVSHGMDPAFITGAHGAFSATVHGFDVRKPKLGETVRYISLTTTLEGELHGAELLQSFWPERTETIGADGVLDTRVRIDHGVLQAGSRVAFGVPAMWIGARGQRLQGALDVQGHVDGEATGGNVGVIDLMLRGAQVESSSSVEARADAVSASVRSAYLNLESPFQTATYDATVTGVSAAHADPLKPLLPRGLAVTSGLITASAHLRGALPELTAAGDVDAMIARLVVKREGLAVNADVHASIVLQEAVPASGVVDLGGSDIQASRVSAVLRGALLGATTLDIAASRLRVAGGQPESVELDVIAPGVTLSLPSVNAALRQQGVSAARFASGEATVSGRGHISLERHEADGNLYMTAQGLSVVLPRVEIRGDIAARLAHWRLGWGDSFDMGVRQGEISVSGVSARGYPDAAKVELAAAASAVLWSDSVGFVAGRATGVVSVSVPEVTLPHLQELSRLVSLPSGYAVEGGAGFAGGQMAIDLASARAAGKLHLVTSGVVAHVGAETLKGDVRFDGTARTAADGVSTDVSGTTVELDHVQTLSASDWWAKATVESGVIGHSPMGWRGRLSLHLGASDARPASGVVAKLASVPKWVVGLLSLPNLEGDGELCFGLDSLEIRDVVVRGKTSWLRLELARRDSVTQGLVLVRQGPLEAGFGLGTETPKFVLFGGEKWFAARKLSLDAERSPADGRH